MTHLRRHSLMVRAVFAFFVAVSFTLSWTTFGLATTVGVLNGRVTDAATHLPVANVRVTAASPSGSYHATTDSHGFYSITGVPADTYFVSFQSADYQAATVAGVTVFADQSETVNQALTKVLRTIAQVQAHGPGSAFQPTQTVDTVSIGTQQIQQFQGSTFNISEVNILSSLPGAELDSSGYPVIHGGREYEEGFEFEGIPYVDAYSNQFTNSLAVPTTGLSSVQLTPGGGDITQTSGGFGALNVIAKRGTYPSYALAGLAIGGPGFDHRFTFDYSSATPDGRFSNYASFAGSNETFNFGNNQHPYAQIGRFFSDRMESDREFLDNFVFRFGSNNHESVQLFTDIGMHSFYEGGGGLAGLCFASCDTAYTSEWSGLLSLIPPLQFITPTQITNISALYPGQNSPTETLAQAGDRAPFTFWQPNQAYKVEYTNNLNNSTFLSLTGYRLNSVTTFDGPSAEGGINDIYITSQGGMTNGVTLALQKQLSEKHLFKAGADVSHLHSIDSYSSDSFAFFGSLLGLINGFPEQYFLPAQFISPSDPEGCLTAVGCSWAYQGPYANATQLKFPQFDQVGDVDRQDYSLYLSDKWSPNDKFNAEFGARLDAATYRMPTPGIDPTYCTTAYLPITWVPPTAANWDPANGKFNCDAKATFSFPNDAVKPKVPQPQIGLSYRMGSNTAVRLTYRRAVQFVSIGDVAFGDVDPNAYLVPFGMIPTFEPFGPGTSSCGFAGTAQQAAPGQSEPAPLAVACRNFGEQLYWINQNFDGIAFQTVRPTTSDNYEFTFQHQFASGLLNGVAVSISPWYRNQHDTRAAEASPLVGSNGQPVVSNGSILFGPPVITNNGKEHATGIDFNLTRQVPYGISGQLTMTYINEFSSVIPLSVSEDFYPSIEPASLALGNIYRVGFLSPFQGTLALSYQTRNGWRINPRFTYNIGYPTGQGLLTAAFVNGVPFNVPNTNAVASTAPGGPACYVDPQNPGSVLHPVLLGCSGASEAASPGGKLTPPNSFTNVTIEYSPPTTHLTLGFDVENLFDQTYSGAQFSARYQPIATGISGPLSGFSTNPVNYTNYPSAWPQYGSFIKTNGPWVAVPQNIGRTFYFYVKTRL